MQMNYGSSTDVLANFIGRFFLAKIIYPNQLIILQPKKNVNKVVLINETKLQNQLNYQNEGTKIDI